MFYLTDHATRTQPLLPAGCAWQPCDAAALRDSDQRLWRLFGGGHELWRGGGGDVPAEADQRRVLLIDDAPQSQFQVMVQALQRGVDLPDGLTCLALTGSGFRGQRNRAWTALRGNLHLTVHYRLRLPAAEAETGLIMLPAVAAARTIDALTNRRLQPRIKWVNDILVRGCKVAGVLTSTQVQDADVRHVVFGIGMNITRCPEITPAATAQPPAALADLDPSIAAAAGRQAAPPRTPDSVHPCVPHALPLAFHTLLRYLDDALAHLLREGASPLYDAYRAMADFVGRPVRIWPDSPAEAGESRPLATGRVRSLLPDLSLLIEGTDRPIRKGRMELLKGDARG